jgi:hypothetical protein
MAKDFFDQFWEWANKPADSRLGISADIHGAVMGLDPEDRNDREKVNEAVRHALDPNIETIWYYEHGEQLETFKTNAEGEAWLQENDPEGVLWKEKRGPLIPAD